MNPFFLKYVTRILFRRVLAVSTRRKANFKRAREEPSIANVRATGDQR